MTTVSRRKGVFDKSYPGEQKQSEWFAPLDDSYQNDSNGDDKQDVDVSMNRVTADHTQQPHHHEYHKYRPKHILSPLPFKLNISHILIFAIYSAGLSDSSPDYGLTGGLSVRF